MAPTDLSIKLHLYVLVHSTQQQDTRELSSVLPHLLAVLQLLSRQMESNINFGSASEAMTLLNRKHPRQIICCLFYRQIPPQDKYNKELKILCKMQLFPPLRTC